MGNYSYLVNASVLTNNISKLRSEPDVESEQVGEAKYRLPIPWMLFFRPEDLRPIRVDVVNGEYTEAGEEGDEGDDDGPLLVNLPCTTVEQALARLREALPIFEEFAGDKEIARGYWQDTVDFLQGLPLPYLTLEMDDFMSMADPVEMAQSLAVAIAGGPDAHEQMAMLASFADGVMPFPREFFFSSEPYKPTTEGEVRRENAVAMFMNPY